jgi:hypothetical protein
MEKHMDIRKNVLLVTNSTTDDELAQIKKIFMQPQAELDIKLSIVHIMPTLPICYFNIPSMVLLAERYYEEAKQTLTYIGDALQITQRDQWLITGRARIEVMRLAAKLNTHFILAGKNILPELRKSFIFSRREVNSTPIKTIHQMSSSAEKLFL